MCKKNKHHSCKSNQVGENIAVLDKRMKRPKPGQENAV